MGVKKPLHRQWLMSNNGRYRKYLMTVSDDNKNTFSDNSFKKQGTMSHITRLNGWLFFLINL